MLQYLIIQLCDTSTSYCHYENHNHIPNLINLDELKAGIVFAMKQNLMIQFVYPDKELPKEYKDVIETIDHNNIVSSLCEDKELVHSAEIVIFHDWIGLNYFKFSPNQAYVLRTNKDDFFDRFVILKDVLAKIHRLNVIFTDIASFSEEDFLKYKSILAHLAENIKQIYKGRTDLQLNILTDRFHLSVMNNCNAGCNTITLAPDGCFYACPAFYLDGDDNIGDIHNSLNIKNQQLYRLDHAPICRHCDAYQCKRCIWLNKKTTLEINTPSHQQCVISHLERNTSREMLMDENLKSLICEPSEIKEINYLDPFDVRNTWDCDLLQKELIKFHKENY